MKSNLDRLAVEMFFKFSRFEYALKATGFHFGNGDAKANWDKFAVEVVDLFENPAGEDFIKAIEYIENNPPKKQIIEADVLEWDTGDPGKILKSDKILIYVRRVRNNLFHGGKFNGRWFDPERSSELIGHSLVILDACLKYSEPVRVAFEDSTFTLPRLSRP